jgi:hypothetical protein
VQAKRRLAGRAETNDHKRITRDRQHSPAIAQASDTRRGSARPRRPAR